VPGEFRSITLSSDVPRSGNTTKQVERVQIGARGYR